MFEEFIKCFRPFKRAAMMLMWPTGNISLKPVFYGHFLAGEDADIRTIRRREEDEEGGQEEEEVGDRQEEEEE
ncbi:hypothetical protein EYF80_060312 [Liparis tanakae]|uniref:Uncharacterized protein n=1 Tax=Liparis tanakae TaxID=230148 RepID=A0A4Z2EL61_9TELE|nr:hypothetical protein EYF80_060312 [Liparis tanakae]